MAATQLPGPRITTELDEPACRNCCEFGPVIRERSEFENWDLADLNRRVADFFEERGYSVAGGEIHDGSGWPSWRNRTDVLLKALFPKGKSGA